MAAKSYDYRCYELANIFLSDEDHKTIAMADRHAKRCVELAKAIQSAIKHWIEANKGG